MRIRFLKSGGQRDFLDEVIGALSVSSLRGVLQFGFDLKYSTLKNYYSEKRLMSRELVVELCEVGGIDYDGLEVEELGENWGRVKGGRVTRK